MLITRNDAGEQIIHSDEGRGDQESRVRTLLRSLARLGVDAPDLLASTQRTLDTIAAARTQAGQDGARLPAPMSGQVQDYALVARAQQDHADEVRAAAAAGHPIDLDVIRASLVATRARAQAAADLMRTLDLAMIVTDDTTGASTLEAAFQLSCDDLWPLLDEQLNDVLAGALAARQLLPARITPDALVEAGDAARAAYLRLRDELVPRHQLVRSIQTQALTILAGFGGTLNAAQRSEAAHLRDIDTLWPGWAGPTHTVLEDGTLSTARYDVPPPWNANDPVGRLLWEAASGKAWVPSPTELEREYSAALAAFQDRAWAAENQVPYGNAVAPAGGVIAPSTGSQVGPDYLPAR